MPQVKPLNPSLACRFPLVGWQELPDLPPSLYRIHKKTLFDDRQLHYFRDEPPKEVIEYFKRLEVPCGHCMQCRLNYAREWSARIMAESLLSDRNCFITLTYAPENLPKNGQLVKRDYQLFMKKLRLQASGHQSIYGLKSKNGKHPIRYYMCGEFGEQNFRPHYHACIFNYKPYDLKYSSTNKQGDTLYTSETLTKYWGLGQVWVGELTSQSADYVARYVTKKFKGDALDKAEHYRRIDEETGEIINLQPEYACMSRMPGIGVPFFEKWESDFHRGQISVKKKNGDIIFRKMPRHFERLLEKVKPDLVADLKQAREDALNKRKLEYPEEFTEERLQVHDQLFAISRKLIHRPDTPNHNERLGKKLQRLQDYKDKNDEIMANIRAGRKTINIINEYEHG